MIRSKTFIIPYTAAAALIVAVALFAPSDAAPVPAPANPALELAFKKDVQAVFVKHCYSCHGNGKKKGDLTLDKYTTLASVQADKKTWRSIADMVSSKQMPPDEESVLSEAEMSAVIGFVDQAFAVDCSKQRDPGRVTLRRLNRTEYNNTIRDLVGIDFKPAADFPGDDSGYGFDNIGDVLTMSPLLAEKYLAAADQVFEKLMAESGGPPKSEIVRYRGNEFRGRGVGNVVDTNFFNVTTNGEISRRHSFQIEGEYEVRIRAYQEPFGDEPAKMTLKIGDKEVKTFDVAALKGKAASYGVRQRFTPGEVRFAAVFLNNAKDDTNADPKKRGDRNLVIERLEIEGPFDAKPSAAAEGYKQVFFVKPSGQSVEIGVARQIVTKFVTRAFRRPPKPDEIERLMRLYTTAKAGGEKFEDALRVALTATLVSPNFLFRVEPDPLGPPGTIRPLNDYEIASRLSYFLWSSMPDDALLEVAKTGKLKEPATLEAQVKRMLADPKASAFVANFVGQWLELRNLENHAVDSGRFPQFDDALRNAMKRETEILIENVIKLDRPVTELLTADYTYVNERLARHYGISGVRGEEFQKVSLAGTRRSGVLTHASILTLTAMPTRTSPVKRGVFILENILGTPPPPAPPEVPALADKPKDEADAPLRVRLEKHRSDPNCSVCHMRMDGIGLALENFDALGAWREKDGRFPIDSAGELPGGKKINGPDGLREMLVARKSDFVRCLSEKMLTYALGRGIEEYDRCTIKDIVLSAQKNEHRFSSVVMAIVKSDAFLKKRSKRSDE